MSKRRKLVDAAIYSDSTGQLYELIKGYEHTSVINKITDTKPGYFVISKPYITDSGIMKWRTRSEEFKSCQKAITIAKEKDKMYDKLEKRAIVKSTAEDIDTNINASMGELFHYDLEGAYRKTAEDHSEFDIAQVVALTIKGKSWDGRFSNINKQWADNFIMANNVNVEDYKSFYGCETHPALLDGFTDIVRKNIANRSIEQLRNDNSNEISYTTEQSQAKGR